MEETISEGRKIKNKIIGFPRLKEKKEKKSFDKYDDHNTEVSYINMYL